MINLRLLALMVLSDDSRTARQNTARLVTRYAPHIRTGVNEYDEKKAEAFAKAYKSGALDKRRVPPSR